MNRIEFNEALGAGLPGMPVPADDDIINDYEVHLVEGTAEEGDCPSSDHLALMGA